MTQHKGITNWWLKRKEIQRNTMSHILSIQYFVGTQLIFNENNWSVVTAVSGTAGNWQIC